MTIKILVTGATGFIGTELINYLSNKKFNVSGISNTTNSNNITKIPLNDLKKLNGFMSKNNFDIVIHLAAKVENDNVFDNPMNMFNANCQQTINLLDASVKNKIKKFIFISGHNVYGKTNYLPIDENHVTDPLTNYGLTKLIGEHITKMYHLTYGLQIINLRVSTVYGPGQPRERIIPKMILHVKNNKQMLLHKHKNGFQLLDFVHVRDVCKAIELSCKSKKSFATYNIASGNPITVEEISKLICKFSKNDIFKIKKTNYEINHYFYDISKSKKELKYLPKYFFNKKILSELMNYYK